MVTGHTVTVIFTSQTVTGTDGTNGWWEARLQPLTREAHIRSLIFATFRRRVVT